MGYPKQSHILEQKLEPKPKFTFLKNRTWNHSNLGFQNGSQEVLQKSKDNCPTLAFAHLLLPAQDTEITGDHTFKPIYHIVGLDLGTAQTQTPSLVKEGERKLCLIKREEHAVHALQNKLLAKLRNRILATTTTTKTSITLDL